MRKIDYLDKLLAHIKDKQKREEAQAEITDHLIEKEHWYEEIGYDADTAADRAQEDFGDADVVGEQFDIKSSKIRQNIIVILLAAVYLIFVFLIGPVIDKVRNHSDFQYIFLPIFILILLCYCIKKKLTVSIPIVLLTIIYTVYLPFPNVFIAGASPVILEYIDEYESVVADQRYDMQDLYLNSILPHSKDVYDNNNLLLLVIVCGVGAMIICYKTAKLKNTKKDFYINIVYRAIVIVIAIGITAQNIYCFYDVMTFKNSYIEKAYSELTKEDDAFLDFINDGSKKSYFLNHKPENKFLSKYINYTWYFTKSGLVNVDMSFIPNYDAEYIPAASGYIWLELTKLDPELIDTEKMKLYSEQDGKALMENKDIKYPEDLPKPFAAHYHFDFSLNNNEETFTAVYDCRDYGEINFEFVKTDGKFVLESKTVY